MMLSTAFSVSPSTLTDIVDQMPAQPHPTLAHTNTHNRRSEINQCSQDVPHDAHTTTLQPARHPAPSGLFGPAPSRAHPASAAVTAIPDPLMHERTVTSIQSQQRTLPSPPRARCTLQACCSDSRFLKFISCDSWPTQERGRRSTIKHPQLSE